MSEQQKKPTVAALVDDQMTRYTFRPNYPIGFTVFNTISIIVVTIMQFTQSDAETVFTRPYSVVNSVLCVLMLLLSTVTYVEKYTQVRPITEENVTIEDVQTWMQMVYMNHNQQFFTLVSFVLQVLNFTAFVIISTFLVTVGYGFPFSVLVQTIVFASVVYLLRHHVIPLYFHNACAYYSIKADLYVQKEYKRKERETNDKPTP